MNVIKKIKNWLTGADKDAERDADYEDWKKSYEEWKESFEEMKSENMEFNRLMLLHDWISCTHPVSVEELDKALFKGREYKLVRAYNPFQGWDNAYHFLIQLRYYGEDNYSTVRDFSYSDTEYAEKCARECFAYLTRDITVTD